MRTFNFAKVTRPKVSRVAPRTPESRLPSSDPKPWLRELTPARGRRDETAGAIMNAVGGTLATGPGTESPY